MTGDLAPVRVGQASVHFLNAGLLQVDLASWLRVPEHDWTPDSAPFFTQPIVMPALCALIELPTTLILVDAGDPQCIAGGEYDALAEAALLIAAHIPRLGRLRPTPAGVDWDDA